MRVRAVRRPAGATRRVAAAARGVLSLALGVGLPILVIYLLIQLVVARPAPTPDPPSLADAPPAATGGGMQLVGGIDGRWDSVRDESWIGYRIEERYVRLPDATEGAGRTNDVEATMTIEGLTVVDVEVVGDVRTLESADWRRDREVQLRWLEAEQHPEVRFSLSEPIELAQLPDPGEVVETTAHGDLTVRGITRRVAVPIAALWDGRLATVTGIKRVTLADFGIATPFLPSYVQAAPVADIEFQLTFARGPAR